MAGKLAGNFSEKSLQFIKIFLPLQSQFGNSSLRHCRSFLRKPSAEKIYFLCRGAAKSSEYVQVCGVSCASREQGKFIFYAEAPPRNQHIFRRKICGNSSVGRARPCQGRGREFESRFPLQTKKASLLRGFFVVRPGRTTKKSADRTGLHSFVCHASLPMRARTI